MQQEPAIEQPGSPVTELLIRWAEGETEAWEELAPLVYEELRSIAHRQMGREAPGHLLQTTALIHEAYLRLIDAEVDWQGRTHFYAVAARLMRRVLVDFARARNTAKRGGEWLHLPLEESLLPAKDQAAELERLDDAITSLAKLDRRKAEVVELRYFGGLTIAESAMVLGVSHATIERDLKTAKVWLTRELSPQGRG